MPDTPDARTPSRGPTARAHEKILEEHRRLREQLDRLEGVESLEPLASRLPELATMLRCHFAGEEEPGGFYDTIMELAPPHLARIDEMRGEHREILSEIDELAARAKELLDREVSSLVQRVRAVVERLRAHEQEETELLIEGMYTDTGGGD